MRGRRKPRGSPSLTELLPLLQCDSFGYSFGRERGGGFLTGNLQDDTPMLILGAVGTGKTLLLASILRQLYAANGPDRLQVTFIDPDRGLAPLFERKPQTRQIAVNERELLNALLLPFEEARTSETPYQLIIIDELLWLGQRAPLQGHWQHFQNVLTRLSEDESLRQRVGLLATSIIGIPEINACFPSTVYILRDFPMPLWQQVAEDPSLERLVRKHCRGTYFIKRCAQDYRLFRAPFLSVTGPPSLPDLKWEL